MSLEQFVEIRVSHIRVRSGERVRARVSVPPARRNYIPQRNYYSPDGRFDGTVETPDRIKPNEYAPSLNRGVVARAMH
jgi:hypothetical protein